MLYDKILSNSVRGGVSELVDEHDLGSCAAKRRGSNPRFPTKTIELFSHQLY